MVTLGFSNFYCDSDGIGYSKSVPWVVLTRTFFETELPHLERKDYCV